MMKSCKLFIKNNPEVIVTRVNKGNITVVLNRIDYFKKIKDMLKDTSTYTEIKKDLTRKEINTLKILLIR